jgi:hypothetical protein
MIKALMKIRIERIYLSIIKAVYVRPIANIQLNRGKLKLSPLK